MSSSPSKNVVDEVFEKFFRQEDKKPHEIIEDYRSAKEDAISANERSSEAIRVRKEKESDYNVAEHRLKQLVEAMPNKQLAYFHPDDDDNVVTVYYIADHGSLIVKKVHVL